MIPSHAPTYYFSGLTLIEYLQSFYCWYIGAFDNRKTQLIFHRFIPFSQEDVLPNASKQFLIEEFKPNWLPIRSNRVSETRKIRAELFAKGIPPWRKAKRNRLLIAASD